MNWEDRKHCILRTTGHMLQFFVIFIDFIISISILYFTLTTDFFLFEFCLDYIHYKCFYVGSWYFRVDIFYRTDKSQIVSNIKGTHMTKAKNTIIYWVIYTEWCVACRKFVAI